MDIGKSFAYVFEDSNWRSKLGLGAVIAIAPILNFAWVGYTVGIVRNVLAGDPRPLPDWSDLGKKFVDGLVARVWIGAMSSHLFGQVGAAPVGGAP